MVLHELLTRLAAANLPKRDADLCTREVDKLLRAQIVPMLDKQGLTPRKLSPDVIEDAIQKVLFKASMGTARFRGSTPGEAWNWCARIAGNEVRDYFKKIRPTESLEPATTKPRRPEAVGESPMADERALGRLLQRLYRHLEQTRSGELAADQARVLIEQRLGASIDEQVQKWVFRDGHEERTPEAKKKAAARIYQWRKRGRDAALAAVEELASAGALDEFEAQLMRDALGVGRRARQN